MQKGDALDPVGLAALREMTRIRPGVKAILASGYPRQDALQWFGDQGLAAFIQKPFTPEAFARKVRTVLDSEPVRR